MFTHWFNRPSLSNVVNRVENHQDVFTLADRMRNLSLNDRGASSSSNLIPNLTPTAERFKKLSNPSSFTRNLMDRTKAPFIDIQNPITTLTGLSSGYMMSLGFRFLPGQSESLVKDIRVPESLEGLRNLRDSLGLSLTKGTLNGAPLLKLKGLSEMISNKSSMLASRILVEAFTFHDGYYGRFLVLVHIGLGCTVWYGFAPGNGVDIPTSSDLAPLFNVIEDYESFFTNPDSHVYPGFNKMTLVEGNEIPVTQLTKAFVEERPFLDIEIPKSNSSIIIGVSLGLAVAILLTFGITPNCGEGII